MAWAMAVRALATTFDARSLIGISSSRIAGGIRGRTSVMQRSSVRRNIRPSGYLAQPVGAKRRLHGTARICGGRDVGRAAGPEAGRVWQGTDSVIGVVGVAVVVGV